MSSVGYYRDIISMLKLNGCIVLPREVLWKGPRILAMRQGSLRRAGLLGSADWLRRLLGIRNPCDSTALKGHCNAGSRSGTLDLPPLPPFFPFRLIFAFLLERNRVAHSKTALDPLHRVLPSLCFLMLRQLNHDHCLDATALRTESDAYQR